MADPESVHNPFLPPLAFHLRKPLPGESILFLDFDGVVHPIRTEGVFANWNAMAPLVGKAIFLPDLVARVLRICESANARIVITSAWRTQGWGFEPFNGIFAGNVIGQIPELLRRAGTPGHRELEVNAYLAEISRPINYAILDDKKENFFPDNPRLFLTNPETGITEDLEQQLIDFFLI
jgi:hypothetical protein